MEEVIDFSITPAVPGAFRDNYRPLFAAVIGQHFSVIKAMCSTALSFNPITDHSLSQPRSSNHTLHHLRSLGRGAARIESKHRPRRSSYRQHGKDCE